MITVQIGFAKAVITPPLPVALSGYGARTGAANHVHDDLEVRVMVAVEGDAVLVLLSLDLMAMSRDWADAIRDAVAGELGIADRAAMLTSTVHTHAAPSTITGTDALGWVVPHQWRPALVDADGSAMSAITFGVFSDCAQCLGGRHIAHKRWVFGASSCRISA